MNCNFMNRTNSNSANFNYYWINHEDNCYVYNIIDYSIVIRFTGKEITQMTLPGSHIKSYCRKFADSQMY